MRNREDKAETRGLGGPCERKLQGKDGENSPADMTLKPPKSIRENHVLTPLVIFNRSLVIVQMPYSVVNAVVLLFTRSFHSHCSYS